MRIAIASDYADDTYSAHQPIPRIRMLSTTINPYRFGTYEHLEDDP
jgi:hypothetical protein